MSALAPFEQVVGKRVVLGSAKTVICITVLPGVVLVIWLQCIAEHA
jgi:hypothetical protein